MKINYLYLNKIKIFTLNPLILLINWVKYSHSTLTNIHYAIHHENGKITFLK
jgi:hypothetical protein